MRKSRRWLLAAAPVVAVAVALPAHALYKVVGPDGKVTYTDTPPPASSGSKVMKLGASNNVITEVTMPLEVRQAMQRYPVTLYTTSNCQPCDNGRQLLKQRGIPFNEKLVISGEDGDELLRLSGSRDAPTLTIGAQVMRGFASDAWASYLDSAGYPRESRLPATYQYPTPTPLVAPPAPVAREAAPPQPVTQPQQPAPTEPSPSGIKF